MSLYDAKMNESYIIESLPAIDLVRAMGIRKGQAVSMLSRQPFGGPVVVQIGSRCIALGKDVAREIQMRCAE